MPRSTLANRRARRTIRTRAIAPPTREECMQLLKELALPDEQTAQALGYKTTQTFQAIKGPNGRPCGANTGRLLRLLVYMKRLGLLDRALAIMTPQAKQEENASPGEK